MKTCPCCSEAIDPESYDYVSRSRAAEERDDRIRVRCPHCTETIVIGYDGTLLDPDAGFDAMADAEDDERRYGPENSASDYEGDHATPQS